MITVIVPTYQEAASLPHLLADLAEAEERERRAGGGELRRELIDHPRGLLGSCTVAARGDRLGEGGEPVARERGLRRESREGGVRRAG